MAKTNNGRQIKMLPIDQLQAYSQNARTHSEQQVKQIAASLQEFGWTNPILIDEKNGIIAGHARVLAAKQLGYTSVPTLCLSGLTEAQVRAYILADNKLALNAGWDEKLLQLELNELKNLEFNLDLIGFDGAELADIMYGPDIEQKEYDESAADDVQLITCPKCGQSFPK